MVLWCSVKKIEKCGALADKRGEEDVGEPFFERLVDKAARAYGEGRELRARYKVLRKDDAQEPLRVLDLRECRFE